MSIFRRGLLAAGLAVAVAGALGVVGVVATVQAAGPGGPPALLPWGAKPRLIEKAGSWASRPVPKYAPKGRGAPPAPPSGAMAADGKYVYLYATGRQDAEVDGVAALLTVARPLVGPADRHSLAEVAVQSADTQQAVEVGWTVDRLTNGDEATHLFVYHWVDGKETCYNGCGFVPYPGASIVPGAALTVDVTQQFGIQHFNGAWWLGYGTEWIGSFPDDIWKGKFTRTGIVQVYGEVTAASTTPCTQMGNGKKPTDPTDTTTAKIGSVTYVNGPAVALKISATSPLLYPTFASTTGRGFVYGGPGRC